MVGVRYLLGVLLFLLAINPVSAAAPDGNCDDFISVYQACGTFGCPSNTKPLVENWIARPLSCWIPGCVPPIGQPEDCWDPACMCEGQPCQPCMHEHFTGTCDINAVCGCGCAGDPCNSNADCCATCGGDTMVCNAAGECEGTAVPVCGDGFCDAPETCDPSDPDYCDADCGTCGGCSGGQQDVLYRSSGANMGTWSGCGNNGQAGICCDTDQCVWSGGCYDIGEDTTLFGGPERRSLCSNDYGGCSGTSAKWLICNGWTGGSGHLGDIQENHICCDDSGWYALGSEPADCLGTFCGDGNLDPGEECDDGGANGACPASCSSSCTLNSCCGDGTCQAGENCGSCPADCGCSGANTCCGSGCVNVDTDPNNCGTCGNVCGAGMQCTGGNCVCQAGKTDTRYVAGAASDGLDWTEDAGALSREASGNSGGNYCCTQTTQCTATSGGCVNLGVDPAAPEYVCENTANFVNAEFIRCDSSHEGELMPADSGDQYCCSKNIEPFPPLATGDYGFGLPSVAIKNEGNTVASCTDSSDNDCDREADYDGNPTGVNLPKGDNNCPVGVIGATPNPKVLDELTECQNDIEVICEATVGNIVSIDVDVPGSTCTRDMSYGTNGWSGTLARWTCTPPTSPGTHTVRCLVDESISYAVPGQEEATDTIDVDCHRNVTGTVVDVSSGNPIEDATVNVTDIVDTWTTTLSDGSYDLGPVLVGMHNFSASAEFFEPKSQDEFIWEDNPEIIDFALQPEQCTPACTFGGVCNYDCFDSGLCNPWNVPPADEAEFKFICNGASPDDERDFNSSHIAICCTGGIEPKTHYETPLVIESCSENLIQHKKLVEYNGKLHQLTVISYRKCN